MRVAHPHQKFQGVPPPPRGLHPVTIMLEYANLQTSFGESKCSGTFNLTQDKENIVSHSLDSSVFFVQSDTLKTATGFGRMRFSCSSLLLKDHVS